MVSAIFAENRFGLGPIGGKPSPVGSDPRGWLLAQIGRFQPQVAGLPTRAEVTQRLLAYDDMIKAKRLEANMMQAMPGAAAPEGATAAVNADAEVKAGRRDLRDDYQRVVAARVERALSTDTPFAERLVHFWANHFAISAVGKTNVAFGGLLEMEAVRPHIMGRFADLLQSVESHPAMLLYLNQAQSIGPNSVIGSRGALRGNARGLNENLAREIMELHTLGVRTGYSQADVTEFARALTGWTVASVGQVPGTRRLPAPPGDFIFVDSLHEPGARTIIGQTYAAGGEAQGRAVLAALAAHPATARHIATKLSRHFAADDPPPAMVARLEKAFLSSNGDLPTVYRALIASPEAWNDKQMKFRTPWDWSIAAMRGLGLHDTKPNTSLAMLRELGQPVWQPPSPAGWEDEASAWAGPDALVRRVEAAQRLAEYVGNRADARTLAPQLLGTSLSERTATAVSRAESPTTGLALLLSSPEMLRR